MGHLQEVFRTFLWLGCTSFGGPMAHIGIFHRVFVQEKKWLDESQYAQTVAFCQFLPGPASSQVGFALGYQRAGLQGALLAFLGFTLPSVLLMLGLAAGLVTWQQTALGAALIDALKLFAVVVVVDALRMMFTRFCQENWHQFLAVIVAATLLVVPGILNQISLIVLAGCFSWLRGRRQLVEHPQPPPGGAGSKPVPLWIFGILLLGLPLLAQGSAVLALANDFFQAGTWVFGGGHVVLPLLQETLGLQVESSEFLTGYALAQAVPGPMFTFATWLGAKVLPDAPVWGAILATGAIFLPGFLLWLGLHPLWSRLQDQPRIQPALAGINAAVVGLLLAALYQPVFVTAVGSALDMAVVLVGLWLCLGRRLTTLRLLACFLLWGTLQGLFVN